MKTYDCLFEDVTALPNMYRAYSKAKTGKKDESYRLFEEDLHGNLMLLRDDLLAGTYTPSPYTVFYVSDYKERRIMAPHFRDHVVHHAIHNVLEGLYDAAFIYDSYACRTGKGTHKGFFRLKRLLNKYGPDAYYMKCDVTKYFYSVDHYKLIGILGKKVKDERLLNLLRRIIGSHCEEPLSSHVPNPDHAMQEKGIPIGNLTSQLFANIYLSELDYYVKHTLGVAHYVRYMDDFIILSRDKDYLNRTWKKIHSFLDRALCLKLERRKTEINRIRAGVDFLGYVSRGRHIRVRTRNYRRFIKKFKKKARYAKADYELKKAFKASYASYMGHLGHTYSGRVRERVTKIYSRAGCASDVFKTA